MSEEKFYTIVEFAELINYGERSVRQMCIDGKIKADKIHGGRKWLIPASELERLRAGKLITTKATEEGDQTGKLDRSISLKGSESPFEEAVEYALVKKGFKVNRQVEIAGYKIDLAILSEDGSKYDIGIECDGSAYHNTPEARDRDRLRQQALEGLGWKLHRVRSTAWFRNPAAELDRIEADIHLARSGTFDKKPTS